MKRVLCMLDSKSTLIVIGLRNYQSPEQLVNGEIVDVLKLQNVIAHGNKGNSIHHCQPRFWDLLENCERNFTQSTDRTIAERIAFVTVFS